jgi:hypothetical protein
MTKTLYLETIFQAVDADSEARNAVCEALLDESKRKDAVEAIERADRLMTQGE